MSKQIIDHGFGVIETRETFYTEETISKLNQQITELQKQLAEKEKSLEYFRDRVEKAEKEIKNNYKEYNQLVHEYNELIIKLKSQPSKIVKKIKAYYKTSIYDRPNAHTEVSVLIHRLDTILKEYQKEEGVNKKND